MVCYAVNSVSIHQLPPLSDLLSGAKDADSDRPWMAKTLNCSWSRLVNLKKTAMIASHKSDGSAANSASWCQRVHQGANMRCTKGAPSLSCGGPASKKWTFASLVCCCCLALHCSGLRVHFWLAGSTIALSIVIHSILCWWLCWSVSDWQSIYGSVSAGREKRPFNVLFFLKVEPPCDQTWWDSLVFSIPSCFSYVSHAENTLVGPVGPF